MTQIQNLTNSADQIIQLITTGGQVVTLELIYSGTCERWWINVSYGNTTINGIGLCTFPNNLRQWMNIFPFGLSTVTTDGTDPFDINDFATERVTLFYLNATDVQNIEKTVFGSTTQI